MLIDTLLSTYCSIFVGINGYCFKSLSVTYLSIIEEKWLLKSSAIIVELFLKPYCLFDRVRVLFISRNVFNRLLKSFSNILKKCESEETGL